MAFVQTVYADCALPPQKPSFQNVTKICRRQPISIYGSTPPWDSYLGYRGFDIPLTYCYIYTYKALWLYCGYKPLETTTYKGVIGVKAYPYLAKSLKPFKYNTLQPV